MNSDEMARACAEAMLAKGEGIRWLGMELQSVGPGRAVFGMTIAATMTNGHGNCHGGFIFSLADTAFGFACNSYNANCVAQHCNITFVTPAVVGDRLTATCVEVSRAGRSGVYDVTVTNQRGETVALMRGHSRMVKGEVLGNDAPR